MDRLPSHLEEYILKGKETKKIDLKKIISLGNKNDRREFAKDVCAIANSGHDVGYIIGGVNDKKDRKRGEPAIAGMSVSNEEDFISQAASAIKNYCYNPPPIIEITFCEFKAKPICLVTIRSRSRLHLWKPQHPTRIAPYRSESHSQFFEIEEIVKRVKKEEKDEGYSKFIQEFISDLAPIGTRSKVQEIIYPFAIKKLNMIINSRSHKDGDDELYFYIAKLSYEIEQLEKALESVEQAFRFKRDAKYKYFCSKVNEALGERYYQEANVELDESFKIDLLKEAKRHLEASRDNFKLGSKLSRNAFAQDSIYIRLEESLKSINSEIEFLTHELEKL